MGEEYNRRARLGCRRRRATPKISSPAVDNFRQTGYKLVLDIAAVAQSVEQRTENPRVNSSILFGGTALPLRQGFFCPFANVLL
jgi:hypothetical protein